MVGAVFNVSEARRELPRLIREVTGGTRAFRIGPRGQAAAVLVSADAYDALRRRAAAAHPARAGWSALRLEISGSPDDLDRAMKQVRKELNDGLKGRVERLSAPPPLRRRRS